MRYGIVLALVASCAYGKAVRTWEPQGAGFANTTTGSNLRDFRCFDPPRERGPSLHHLKNHFWATPQAAHRGTDLISTDDAAEQIVRGKLAHSIFDKAIEDEDVKLYACFEDGWHALGTARTDDDGRFELHLRGVTRIPLGIRDLYASAPDQDDFRFLAYVAPRGASIIISDIDGTLTQSEGAFPKSMVWGADVRAQPDAAAALRDASAAGYQLVYITARGDRFTDATRRWLVDNGFPRGPLRLAKPMFVMPGAATVEYKWNVVVGLRQTFSVAAGLGNRASDVAAYRMAGLPARRTFIKLPEFSRELERDFAAHRAIGFRDYGPLPLPTLSKRTDVAVHVE